jgi:adenosylcobyric acid synthase
MAQTPIMIMGCTSDAGKSFLVAALCRHFAKRGVRVAPFKAQNMSNHAAVTPDGLEIGRAQYLQALAARTTPDARMNPVLLKPSADTHSQVIVMGRFDPRINALPWMERKAHLWPIVCDALRSLRADYELVVIEGAGSPAEVNLRQSDIVNMSIALECQAAVYLVADIDRGGAFAHLLGTWLCLTSAERALVKGFVLNKFRGDRALLGNAMDWLRERTGVPTVALVPMLRHALPEEDTLHHRAQPVAGQINLALLAYPYASNLDEFDPLIHERGVTVVPLREHTPLQDYHALLLPGSKNTAASLRHLRATGLAAEIARFAQSGKPVIGICGGLQMLGHHIADPHHLESGNLPGLGLLDLTTTLALAKVTRQRQVRWEEGAGLVQGYEIHHGQTHAGPRVRAHLADDLGWRQENITGVYLHGLFENTTYRQHFLTQLGWRGHAVDWRAQVERELDRVAELVETSGWSSAFPEVGKAAPSVFQTLETARPGPPC